MIKKYNPQKTELYIKFFFEKEKFFVKIFVYLHRFLGMGHVTSEASVIKETISSLLGKCIN